MHYSQDEINKSIHTWKRFPMNTTRAIAIIIPVRVVIIIKIITLPARSCVIFSFSKIGEQEFGLNIPLSNKYKHSFNWRNY